MPEWTPRIFILTREQSRAVDRAATEELGLPSIVLMEHAANALASECEDAMEFADGPCWLFCGPGANGGDGLACARLMHNAGFAVEVFLTHADGKYVGDAGTHLRVARAMKLAIHELDGKDVNAFMGELIEEGMPALAVDALLGTGLTGPVREPVAAVVRAINTLRGAGATVIAADVPTGLDCDTGRPLGDTVVKADVTVTFGGVKRGLLEEHAQEYVGQLELGDIGVPPELLARFGTEMEVSEDDDD